MLFMYNIKIGIYLFFMKHIQCVLARLPDICPKIGFSCVSFKSSETLISVSFHLKIRKPPGFNTRKHSTKPLVRISRQPFPRCPYLIICQPFNSLVSPEYFKWGGSNTTIEKMPSGYGISVKSACTSGWTSKWRPSQSVVSISRISWNNTRSSFLSK